MDYFSYLQLNFLGNSVKDYLITIFVFFISLAIFKIFQKSLLSKLSKLAQKTKTEVDDLIVKIIHSLRPPFYFFLAFYIAIQFLTINDFLTKIINAVLIIWIIYQTIQVFQILINYLTTKKLKDSKSTISFIGSLSKAILWTFGILLILSNLGINITSLIAGLGIGGVAVALALQNILGDLFSSLAIHLDKPFEEGDFIIVGEDLGVVKKIGIKTTRILSLQGEEIVISNKELTSTRVHNYKKMRARRVVFSFGVTYDTPLEKLKRIPQIIKEIIERQESAQFDRAHFHKYGDSALLFEIVYYVKTGDYNQYMNVNQEIHFKIKEIFEKENISFAFPTQTIYLRKES